VAIRSFRDKATRDFHNDGVCPPKWRVFQRVAEQKLDMLEAADALIDLASPPGNRLEKLKGDRKGQYSIRINQQFRICFNWSPQGAESVEIVDYH